MTRSCRLGLAMAAALLVPGPAPAQAPNLADRGRLILATDPKLKQKLEAVEDYAKSEDWEKVAKHAQDLLDVPQDVFVQLRVKGPGGAPFETLVTYRAAAERLLAGLPRDKAGGGLGVYEAMHGAAAKTLLRQAVADDDKQKLADAARRYLWTDAGREAVERLGTILLEDGDFAAAANAFDRLIQRDGLANLEPLTLFKAARAFHLAGDKDAKRNALRRLQAKAPKGLRVNRRDLSPKEMEEEIEKPAGRPPADLTDWPMFRGNPGRNGQARGGAPFMQALWRQPLFGSEANQVKDWIANAPTSAVKRLEAKGEAVIPATAPVAVTITTSDGKPKPIVVFRGYDGVHAVEVKSGKLHWVSKSVWSLEAMFKDPQKQETVEQWVGHFKDQAGKPDMLLGNATLGTMSSDGSRVYFIDDLAVPFDAAKFGAVPPAVAPGVTANKLQAVSVASGKLLWELGGAGAPAPAGRKHDFRNTHFLGAPLCLGGKLYFLNEKDQEIRLVCFDSGRLRREVTAEDLDAAVAWVQPLGAAKDKIVIDYGRRIHGAPMAYGEGVLVCPTNAGVLVGVDVLTHGILWTHAYPSTPAAVSEWKASAPVVQDSKVVFAPSDGAELRCLSLRDGKLLWDTKRGEDGVYLAGVFAGRAVVVGKKDVRGLALDNGKELWRVATGMPSGRGAASDNVYYLPLRDAGGKGPAVVAIELTKGKVISVDPTNKDRDGKVEVPGNLTFFAGQVISQSATEVVAYPLLKDKPKEPGNRDGK